MAIGEELARKSLEDLNQYVHSWLDDFDRRIRAILDEYDLRITAEKKGGKHGKID